MFVLVFVLLTAASATSGYFYFRHFAEHTRANVEQELATIGDQKVNELVRFREERLADAAILFRNRSFFALVSRFLDRTKHADARHEIEAWLAKYYRDGNYDSVRLLDDHGVTLLSMPADTPPPSAAVLQRMPDILRSGRVTLQDFHRNERDQRVYLDLLIPILDDSRADGATGVLYLRIDPETSLYPMFNHWPVPAATAEVKLVRRDGNAALYLNELRTRTAPALTERVPLSETNRTAVMAVLGREGIVYGVNKAGHPVVGYLRAVPNSPWFVVLRQETAEADAPVREHSWLIGVLVIALVAGFGAGLWAIWRGERSRIYRDRAGAAEALRQSEDRYQRLFETNPYPAFVYGLETLAFLAVNPAAIAHYGYSRDEFLGMTIKDIRPAEDLARLAEDLASPRAPLQKAGVWRHRKKDGTIIDVEITSHLLVHDGRRAALVIPIDITERIRADAERDRLVAELQSALANVKTLSGLVPICAWCKKIRDDGNYWHQVESFVSRHTDATFSHGICPDCLEKYSEPPHADSARAD